MTVLEAMTTATPVVGDGRSGAVRWLLKDGTGVAIDIDSAADIADTVLAILQVPLYATSVRDRGRSHALREVTVQPLASAYLERLVRVRASV